MNIFIGDGHNTRPSGMGYRFINTDINIIFNEIILG